MTQEWQRAIEARLTVLETRNAVEEVHRVNVESRLNAIEDSLKWLVRLILGAFVLAIVAFALKGGFGTV
ncbi:MAG: hemolysin XhlA family protein [Dinoroseobacter sp.]|nr:hemolysin XhlA family protein [Dinoroseobacter sp.]MDJ0994234.1 hemolysin XhlA family protein [Dinoroseobacter sp.]